MKCFFYNLRTLVLTIYYVCILNYVKCYWPNTFLQYATINLVIDLINFIIWLMLWVSLRFCCNSIFFSKQKWFWWQYDWSRSMWTLVFCWSVGVQLLCIASSFLFLFFSFFRESFASISKTLNILFEFCVEVFIICTLL